MKACQLQRLSNLEPSFVIASNLNTMDIKKFEKLPILGILRGISLDDITPLIEAVIKAGLKTIEITMNTPHAARIISKARAVGKGLITIGAGTVLSKEDAKRAQDAGASFIVTPALVEEVMIFCKKKKMPVFPGAFSPQEVFNAWSSGATMVKVFPCGVLGPTYIKELKGPFDKIKLMAVGGVRLENISEYFSAGASAVAFGAGVFKKEWLNKKDFKSIAKLVSEYVQAVRDSDVTHS